MTSLFSQFSESHSRPADRAWTAEENARYAAGRAETVALAMARAKAKVNGLFVLAEPYWTVTFDVQGDSVTVARRHSRYAKSQPDAPPATMTRAEGRAEYGRLLDCGMWPF